MPASGSERVHSPPSPPGPKIDLKHSAPGRTSLVQLSWHHDTTRSTGPFGTLASDISRIHKPPRTGRSRHHPGRPQGPDRGTRPGGHRIPLPRPRGHHHPVRPRHGRRCASVWVPPVCDPARVAGCRRSRRPRTVTAVETVSMAEEVAQWPRITAIVRPDGTGSLTVNGTEYPCQAASIEQLRAGIIARCTVLAGRLHRPVRIEAAEGGRTWSLAVLPGGIVQPIDDRGTIGPPDGLDVHTGRCRTCQRPQPVTTERCFLCGADDPHRITAAPPEAPGETSQKL